MFIVKYLFKESLIKVYQIQKSNLVLKKSFLLYTASHTVCLDCVLHILAYAVGHPGIPCIMRTQVYCKNSTSRTLPCYSMLAVCGCEFTSWSFLWSLCEVNSGEAVMGKR